ncbi:MAG: T9SS type A sorting domain-containing protein, partial [Saprospiraceae bacterium]
AVGDSVIGPLAWGAGQFRYYIDSVGTLVAGGQTLRFQQVHFYTTVNHDQCNALAIETIGFIHGGCNSNPLVFHFPMGTHLLVDEPNEGAVDGPDWQFCHYQNDHLQYQYTSSLCDGLISQQEPTADLTSFRVQPNPFHDGFSVESGKDQTSGYLRVFDTAGRLVLQASSPFELVPTKAWPQGLYFLEITAKNGSRQFCKAWKE